MLDLLEKVSHYISVLMTPCLSPLLVPALIAVGIDGFFFRKIFLVDCEVPHTQAASRFPLWYVCRFCHFSTFYMAPLDHDLFIYFLYELMTEEDLSKEKKSFGPLRKKMVLKILRNTIGCSPSSILVVPLLIRLGPEIFFIIVAYGTAS